MSLASPLYPTKATGIGWSTLHQFQCFKNCSTTVHALHTGAWITIPKHKWTFMKGCHAILLVTRFSNAGIPLISKRGSFLKIFCQMLSCGETSLRINSQAEANSLQCCAIDKWQGSEKGKYPSVCVQWLSTQVVSIRGTLSCRRQPLGARGKQAEKFWRGESSSGGRTSCGGHPS